MSKTRTFIAIGINPELRAGAVHVIEQLQTVATGFRWVAEENLHFTLHFLGDLDDTEVFQVCDRVSRVASESSPFSLSASGVGAFPSNDRPRTLWVGVGDGRQQIDVLHAALGDSLADLGFRGESRRFVPHMTVGRLSRQGRVGNPVLSAELSSLAEHEIGTMRVEEVMVYASQLRPDGPEYHVLARAPFG